MKTKILLPPNNKINMAVRMLICRKLYILQCMSYLRNTCRKKYACRQGDSYLNFLTEIKQSESAVYASCRIGFARFTTIACLQNISYYTTILLGNQKIHLGFVIEQSVGCFNSIRTSWRESKNTDVYV